MQQGDPLDPLPFCLAVQPLGERLQSKRRIFYLNDGLVGGSAHDVLRDICRVKDEAASLGL